MPEKPKSGPEIFGIRLQFWVGLVVAGVAVLFLLQSAQVDPSPETDLQVAAPMTKSLPDTPVEPRPARVLEATAPVRTRDLPVEVPLALNDASANLPIPVLINELFSPDPEARMAAALRLSRRSLQASEAVPILKKLVHDEPDPKVREVMNEAILNIRGFVPDSFQSLPRR